VYQSKSLETTLVKIRDKTVQEKPWYLYLLYHSVSNLTYVGITTEVARRLRQHRQEIRGGARYTKRVQDRFPGSPPWDLVVALGPFQNRSEATRWERLVKMRCRGITARREAMLSLSLEQHPRQFTAKQKEKFPVPNGLSILEKRSPESANSQGLSFLRIAN
jgi:structure-specific endonuclease subunit SLX1